VHLSKKLRVLGGLLLLTTSSASAQYVVKFLDGTDPNSAALGIAGDQIAGQALVQSQNQYHAFLWISSSYNPVDLNPSGSTQSSAQATSGTMQAGYAYNGGGSYAALWSGTAASIVNLNPAGYNNSAALDISGNEEVGRGIMTSTAQTHALLWSSTATSFIDLNPAGATSSVAIGNSSGQQVGDAVVGGQTHAFVWSGTATSAMDVNPSGDVFSEIFRTDGFTQVGEASNGSNIHAMLWQGTSASAVDLNPAGFTFSEADGLYGNTEVGWGQTAGGPSQALLWHGTAASAIDLNSFLPTGYVSAEITGIDSNGDIVGFASMSSGPAVAVEWMAETTPEPSSISCLGMGIGMLLLYGGFSRYRPRNGRLKGGLSH